MLADMNYLRHLEACNRFDPSRFLPLLLGNRRVGFVRRDNARLLESFSHIFRLSADEVAIVDVVEGAALVTRALAEVTDGLIQTGVVKRRNEMFSVTDGWGGTLLFEIDRGLIEFFGLRAYAVHLNGWRRGGDGLAFWIAKRAASKALAPGKLDHIVAGGIGSGYAAWDTLVKEAGEEAGIPKALAIRANAAGAIRYRLEMAGGMRDEVLFVYDLEIPADFVPSNTDGEVEDFRLLPARECLRLVRDTDMFMYDVNLVLIDFGVRHGLIVPDEPEYLALIEGLRGGFVQGSN